MYLNKLRLIKQVLLSKPIPEDETEVFNCPVCGASSIRMHPFPVHYFDQWQKYQTVHNPFFIETINIAHYICAKCFAFDRERLYALYLQKYFNEKDQKLELLDIAPSDALSAFLKNNPKV